MPDHYVIVTGTDLEGVDWARLAETTGGLAIRYEATGRGCTQRLAKRLISLGFDQSRPVQIQWPNGGKLGSAKSLAELGRVRG